MRLSRRGLLAGCLGLPIVAAFGKPKPATQTETWTTGSGQYIYFGTTTYRLLGFNPLDGSMSLATDAKWKDVT